MPIQSGIELAREIKDLNSKKMISVVLATDVKVNDTEGVVDMIIDYPIKSETIFSI